MPDKLTDTEIQVLKQSAAPTVRKLKAIEKHREAMQFLQDRQTQAQALLAPARVQHDAALANVLVAVNAMQSANAAADETAETLKDVETQHRVLTDQTRASQKTLAILEGEL